MLFRRVRPSAAAMTSYRVAAARLDSKSVNDRASRRHCDAGQNRFNVSVLGCKAGNSGIGTQ